MRPGRRAEALGATTQMGFEDDRPSFLGYLFRLILILVLLGLIGLVAYAYFGDLSVDPAPRSLPVEIDAN